MNIYNICRLCMDNSKSTIDCIENKSIADEVHCLFGFQVIMQL